MDDAKPPFDTKIDLNVWRCTLETSAVPTNNTFPRGTTFVVKAMSLWPGKLGTNNGWEMGFTTSGDQPVQVGSGGGIEDE
ncbi:MAG: hypothetical protein IPF79_01990 [Ignavibacteria bacterium]|nr:hypothetical protein [Ignavibacteria bacterium]